MSYSNSITVDANGAKQRYSLVPHNPALVQGLSNSYIQGYVLGMSKAISAVRPHFWESVSVESQELHQIRAKENIEQNYRQGSEKLLRLTRVSD